MVNNLNLLKNLNKPIFYLTNDVARGIGLENILPNYHIVCLDDHPLIDILEKAGVSVFCLERQLGLRNSVYRNSGTILSHPKVLSFIKEKSNGETPNILFFKPQRRIEILAEKNGFNLIGNSVSVNRFFEDKISFFEICQKENLPVPPGETEDLQKINYSELVRKYGERQVVQFGRGWAGNSTVIISEEKQILNLKQKFGHIKVKVNKYLNCRTILNNAVIYKEDVFVSEPALQIKADINLTSTPTGTGGRQWPCELENGQKEKIKVISDRVGETMKRKGFKGFFGLDFLVEEKTGEVYLAENNARLTYSVPFFTKLELKSGVFPLLGYHLSAFFSDRVLEKTDYEPVLIKGGEIVARNTEDYPVKVWGEVKTGLYRQNFEYKKEVYFLEETDASDIFLNTAAKDRVVNPEIEYAVIDTKNNVCDENGEIREEYLSIIKKVKERLKLSECQD